MSDLYRYNRLSVLSSENDTGIYRCKSRPKLLLLPYQRSLSPSDMSHLLGKSLHLLCKGIGRRAIASGGPKRSLIRHYRVNEGRNSAGSERPSAENVKRESRILSEIARNTVIVIGGVVLVAVYELFIFIKDQASEALNSVARSVKNTKDSIGAEKTKEDLSSGLQQSSSGVFESVQEKAETGKDESKEGGKD
eukprot:gene13375-14701_t